MSEEEAHITTDLPHYIRALKRELDIRVEVELEVAETLGDTLAEAGAALGATRAAEITRPHIEAEVQIRLREHELERKRAGLA